MEFSSAWMQSYIVLGVVLACVAGFYCLKTVRSALTGPAASVPGPWYTRWSSWPVRYYYVTGQRAMWVDGLHKKYGPIVRVRPSEVSVADPQAVREIHRISTPFRKTNWYSRMVSNPAPSMFTMIDPKDHSARRRLLAGPMSETNLRAVEGTVNENVRKAIDGITMHIKKDGSADAFMWFLFMATDVIGELSFAESFRMLDQGKPNQYAKDLYTVGIASGLRPELGPITRILGNLRISPFKDVYESGARIGQYSQQSFVRYEQHVAVNPTNPKPTLFLKMMQKVEGEESLTREQLIREGMSYIVAGSDTTAVSTTYTVYSVCKHPKVKSRLIEELSALPEDFGWDHVRNLPYLNKCIDETLRLYGAAPGALPRSVPKGGAYLAGHTFPEGFTVSTQAYTLHRNPNVFHEPEKFNPDRWDNPTPEMKQSYMPFGAGTRICVGLHLALNEMRMATALFFRRFPNARVTTSDADMEFKAYFLIQPKGKKCMITAS